MEKIRVDFSKGINNVGDKSVLGDGYTTIADNTDLRSGMPRAIKGPSFEQSANANTKCIYKYRGRWYESEKFRNYIAERNVGQDVVYFTEEGTYSGKIVEGITVALGTKAPGVAPLVAQNKAISVAIGAELSTGGIFKKDQVRSYRISVETATGIMPPSGRALVRMTADGGAVKVSWTTNYRALAYLIFGGEEGQEILIARVSSSGSSYTDYGSTNLAGEPATTYEAQRPYRYAYTFLRDILGVKNESGPSPITNDKTSTLNRKITFDPQTDGFFDQLDTVTINSGISVESSGQYAPAAIIEKWEYDPNGIQVKFTTLTNHGLDQEHQTKIIGLQDQTWANATVDAIPDATNLKVFYVKGRPMPTDPSTSGQARAQKVVTKVTLSPTPASPVSTDDAVRYAAATFSGVAKATYLTDNSFELDIYASGGPTGSLTSGGLLYSLGYAYRLVDATDYRTIRFTKPYDSQQYTYVPPTGITSVTIRGGSQDGVVITPTYNASLGTLTLVAPVTDGYLEVLTTSNQTLTAYPTSNALIWELRPEFEVDWDKGYLPSQLNSVTINGSWENGTILSSQSRTNLVINSANPAGSGWTKLGSSIVTNSEYECSLFEDNANGQHQFYQDIINTTSGMKTFKASIKGVGRPYAIIQIKHTDNSIDNYAWINLSTGAVSGISGSPTIISAIGNDGYIDVSISNTFAATNIRVQIYASIASGSVTYTGDSRHALSIRGICSYASGRYIPTTTTEVTETDYTYSQTTGNLTLARALATGGSLSATAPDGTALTLSPTAVSTVWRVPVIPSSGTRKVYGAVAGLRLLEINTGGGYTTTTAYTYANNTITLNSALATSDAGLRATLYDGTIVNMPNVVSQTVYPIPVPLGTWNIGPSTLTYTMKPNDKLRHIDPLNNGINVSQTNATTFELRKVPGEVSPITGNPGVYGSVLTNVYRTNLHRRSALVDAAERAGSPLGTVSATTTNGPDGVFLDRYQTNLPTNTLYARSAIVGYTFDAKAGYRYAYKVWLQSNTGSNQQVTIKPRFEVTDDTTNNTTLVTVTPAGGFYTVFNTARIDEPNAWFEIGLHQLNPTIAAAIPVSIDILVGMRQIYTVVDEADGRYIPTTNTTTPRADYRPSGETMILSDALPLGGYLVVAPVAETLTYQASQTLSGNTYQMRPTVTANGVRVPATYNWTDQTITFQSLPTQPLAWVSGKAGISTSWSVTYDEYSNFTQIKYVPKNGYITHRNLYRTGDTSGWNLVESIPVSKITYDDVKSYNYLGDEPSSWYEQDGVNILFEPPPTGLIGLTTHYDMAFAIDGHKVRWTPEGQYDAWPDSLFFSFEHEPIALASFAQALIVLCTDGIYRLEGTTSTNLRRIGTRAKNGCIAPGSVQVTNAGLIYLSKRGLMAFDGMDARCITDSRINGDVLAASGNILSGDGTIAPSTFVMMPTKYTFNYHALCDSAGIKKDFDGAFEMGRALAVNWTDRTVRSFYVDGKYYMYRSAAYPVASGNTFFVVDLEAPNSPITTMSIRAMDAFVDATNKAYILTENTAIGDNYDTALRASSESQMVFWKPFSPMLDAGRSIMGLFSGEKYPYFIRTGEMPMDTPTDRKRFRSVEFHANGTNNGPIACRVWIDGHYICDGISWPEHNPYQTRKINIPVAMQLGHTLDLEITGTADLRAVEVSYDPTLNIQ